MKRKVGEKRVVKKWGNGRKGKSTENGKRGNWRIKRMGEVEGKGSEAERKEYCAIHVCFN